MRSTLRQLDSSLFVLLAFACGCGPSDPTPVPTPLDQLCARLAEASCALRAECACDASTTCVSEATTLCEARLVTTEVRGAVTSAVLTYDAAAAGRLVAALGKHPADCRTLAPWQLPAASRLGWTELPTLAGTFVGTIPVGAACTVAWSPGGVTDCASGLVCARVGAAFQCVAPGTLGSSCHGACLGAGDLSPESAAALPFCGTDSICHAPGADGAACASLGECISRDCTSAHCVGPAANGASCTENEQCTSGLCGVAVGGAGTCISPGAGGTGAACTQPSDCASGLCVSGRCTLELCLRAVVP